MPPPDVQLSEYEPEDTAPAIDHGPNVNSGAATARYGNAPRMPSSITSGSFEITAWSQYDRDLSWCVRKMQLEPQMLRNVIEECRCEVADDKHDDERYEEHHDVATFFRLRIPIH